MSKHNFFGGTFLLGEVAMLSEADDGRTDNKMAVFLSKSVS